MISRKVHYPLPITHYPLSITHPPVNQSRIEILIMNSVPPQTLEIHSREP